MTERISTLDVRQRLGDMLNRVALRHDEFVIERKGKALAALVPVEKLEQMRRIARRDALAFLDQQKGGGQTEGKATETALAAQAWARKAGKKK
jgi:prevent-host-death family protein